MSREEHSFWVGVILGGVFIGSAAFIAGGWFMRHYGPCDIAMGWLK